MRSKSHKFPEAFAYDARTLDDDGKTSKLADAVIALFHANIKPIDYFQRLVNKQFPFFRMLFVCLFFPSRAQH